MDDPQKRGTSATVTLRVSGQKVGGGKIGNTVPTLFTTSETFDVGEDKWAYPGPREPILKMIVVWNHKITPRI
jgi:hypothetical protein